MSFSWITVFFCLFVFSKCRTLEYLEEVAVQSARDIALGNLKVNRSKKSLVDKVMNFALKYNFAKDFVFNKAKDQVMKMTGGLYPAPLKVC